MFFHGAGQLRRFFLIHRPFTTTIESFIFIAVFINPNVQIHRATCIIVRQFFIEDTGNRDFFQTFTDITDKKLSEEHIYRLAHYDILTGLPNRALLQQRLQQALRLAKRHRHKLAILFLDLDRFKLVNDTLGHAVGDQLLQQVGKQLTACVRKADTVSRLGGDEFVIYAQVEDLTPSPPLLRGEGELGSAMIARQ